MYRNDIWAVLIVIGIIAGVIGIIVGVCYLCFWLFAGIFTLFSRILEVGGVTSPIATTISLVLVIIIVLFCCCRNGNK